MYVIPCSSYGKNVLNRNASQAVDTSIEWPIMDVEPLPFYSRGRIALIGDAVS